MKKRNKQYRPRVVINPLAMLYDRSSEKIEGAEECTLKTVLLSHLGGMTDKSRADEKMWSTIVCMLNGSLELCKSGRNKEMLPTVNAALDAMVIVKMRAGNGHGWALGNHYTAVCAGVNVVIRHMDELPKSAIGKALREVDRQLRAAA